LVKNMSQYFPIDDENKTMETLEEITPLSLNYKTPSHVIF